MTVAGEPRGWDGAVVTSALALTGLGVLMNYSTTAALDLDQTLPPLAVRHAIGVLCAITCGAIAARVPLRLWKDHAVGFWAVSVALLVATFAVGVEAKGAQRWLAVPGVPIAIQPAELARLATPLAIAALLADATPKRIESWAPLQRVALLVLAPVALMVLQPDFGGAVILCAVVGLVLFAAGLPLRMLAVPGAAGAAAVALYVAARPYAQARVRGFIDPWQSAHDEGFQLVQSFVAFGRGGTTGVGLGNGLQKLSYLPEAHTDFILSMIAEELGLLGVLGVLGGFAALCWAGLRIARHARQPFPLLIATACSALIAVPALCNAAVVMGLLPTKGLTLPFLSHGTNSLVCTAFAVGILLRAGREPNGAPQLVRAAPARRRLAW